MTHRQFVTWQYWLSAEWNRPNRSDWYAMRVACEIRRANVTKPNEIKVDQFKLDFKTESDESLTPEQHEERLAQLAKAQGVTRMVNLKYAKATKAEMERIDRLPPDEAARARMARARDTR